MCRCLVSPAGRLEPPAVPGTASRTECDVNARLTRASPRLHVAAFINARLQSCRGVAPACLARRVTRQMKEGRSPPPALSNRSEHRRLRPKRQRKRKPWRKKFGLGVTAGGHALAWKRRRVEPGIVIGTCWPQFAGPFAAISSCAATWPHVPPSRGPTFLAFTPTVFPPFSLNSPNSLGSGEKKKKKILDFLSSRAASWHSLLFFFLPHLPSQTPQDQRKQTLHPPSIPSPVI